MKDNSFKDFVLDQLDRLNGLTCRAMFGGYGLYHGAVFFGIIYRGRLYFKIDSKTLPAYFKAGMKPFRPSAKQTLGTYYEVPVDIIEDQAQLSVWAKKAIRSQDKP